ncbi:hypothetical protein NMG60_11025228 [Bertholletia excelsa]
MASASGKSAAFMLLVLNTVLYLIVLSISGWAINHAIVSAREKAYTSQPIPARIFPIYFPFGNRATGFFVIFSLIAGVVGFLSSILSMHDILQWTAANLHAAAASSIVSWLLTLLAMGFACKEINLGWAESNLRALETIVIILSGTQLFCVGAIHVELARLPY